MGFSDPLSDWELVGREGFWVPGFLASSFENCYFQGSKRFYPTPKHFKEADGKVGS